MHSTRAHPDGPPRAVHPYLMSSCRRRRNACASHGVTLTSPRFRQVRVYDGDDAAAPTFANFKVCSASLLRSFDKNEKEKKPLGATHNSRSQPTFLSTSWTSQTRRHMTRLCTSMPNTPDRLPMRNAKPQTGATRDAETHFRLRI